MFLEEGGEFFEGEGWTGIDDVLGVFCEFGVVVFQGWMRRVGFPLGAEGAQGVEGGRFAEGFLEPFVFPAIRAESGVDVGEFVRELVDVLGPVSAGGVEVDGGFSLEVFLKEGDGAFGAVGDVDGGRVEWREGLDDCGEGDLDFPFGHAKAGVVDAELGKGAEGEKPEEKPAHGGERG